MRRISERPTSVAMRNPRRRLPPPVLPRSPCFNDSAGFEEEDEIAGTRPKKMPVTTEMPRLNDMTWALSPISLKFRKAGGAIAMSSGIAQAASNGAEDPTQNGEEDALGQQLPDEPAAARAHRRANRDLARARGGAREQKVRDVRAADEKEKADCGEKQQQHRPDPAHGIFVQRRHADAGILVVVLILLLEPRD